MSFGMVSTFPPTPCGIATFAAALANALIASGNTVDVVRVGQPPTLEDPSVRLGLDRAGTAAAIRALDRTDAVIVQHEYGIYAGEDGAEIAGLVEGIDVPSILVAHTVLRAPSTNQLAVLRRICAAVDAVVVMTESGRRCLTEVFGVAPDKVRVIPHGAAVPPGDDHPVRPRRASQLLTWGLLGPGKGIEWAIDAFAMLGEILPRPQYVIAGTTHPKVREHAGEAYREMLIQRAWSTGASPHITFDDSYRTLPELGELIAAADLVVLPYDSADQVTSGVLVDAIAAGRPVVSTAFPHAVELLGSGAGIVVPQRDPVALAGAINSFLRDPALAAQMAVEARRLAPDLSWAAVATRYRHLATRVAVESNAVA